MNIRRQFRVVTVNDDGSETRWPMKAWLREKEHQEFVPEGVDVSTTGDSSPQIARRLLADGWSSQEKEDQFLLFPPYGNRPLPVDEDSDDIEPDDEYGFGMERELRDFLAHNLNLVKIGEGSLRLYSDQTQSGIEYKTEVGRIDILAVDDVGAFYVFELKRAASPDSAIGQLTRYMGWVMKTLANGHPVHGLVVAKEITDRLKYAILPIPNVRLFEYKVAFTLKGVEL